MVSTEKERVGLIVKIKRFFKRFEITAEAPQNILASGLWQIVGTLISALLGWLVIVLVSREDIGLGAEGVGRLNTAFAFYGIFMLLTIGMGKAMSQVVSETMSDKKVAFGHVRNGTFVTITTGIIIGIALMISALFLGNPFTLESILSSILFMVGIMIIIAGFKDAFSSNLAAVGEFDDIAKGYIMFPLFQLIVATIIIILIKILSLPLLFHTIIVLIYICGVAAQALFLFKQFRKLWFNKQVFKITQVDRRAFHLVRRGLFFAVTDIIPVGIIGSVCVVIILFFTGNNYEIIGAFSIILGYSLGGLIIVGFAWPMITAVAEAYGQRDSEKIRFYLHLIVKLFFYITFLVLVIDIGLSRGIIYLFHGEIYLTGATDTWIPFMVVISAFAIAGFEYILCSIILGVGKIRAAAVYLGSIVLLVIGFVSLFLWLDLFQSTLINAALGFLIGIVLMMPLLPYLMKRYVNESIPFGGGFRSILALVTTIGIAAILFWPPLNLLPITNTLIFLFAAIILIVCYGFFTVFFGAVSEADLKLLEQKVDEFNLTGKLGFLFSIVRKIMRSSPFCKIEKK